MKLTKSGSLRKDDFMELWRKTTPNQPVNPQSIAYQHKGTTIDQDGIRLTGDPDFIFGVLSNLKHLIDCENERTRLKVAFSELKDKETGRPIPGRFRCSVQVQDRGNQAKAINAFVSAIQRKHK